MKWSYTVVAAATALATLAAPVAAAPTLAPSSNPYVSYRVEFVDSGVHAEKAGALVASLRIETSRDGIVNGYYRIEGMGTETPLDGSFDGTRLNLHTVGPTLTDLTGKYAHGEIVGSGYLGDREVDFTAKPVDEPPAA